MSLELMSSRSLAKPIRRIDLVRDKIWGFEISLRTLLSCVNEHGPVQAVIVAVNDLPRPWSIAGVVQAAHIPVMTALNHTSRGHVHVVSVKARYLDAWIISRYLRNVGGTNPLGIFIIMYIDWEGLSMTAMQNVHKAFFQRLGTNRLIHLFSDSHHPNVAFSEMHNAVTDEWFIEAMSLSDFCEGQRDELTRRVALSSDVRQLKGLRFEFVFREQHVWRDRNNNTRIGGRDVMFARLLQEFGMQYMESGNGTFFDRFRCETMELTLPASNLASYFKFSYLLDIEYTAVIEQSDDFLVVRRAPRIPFGLVLVLPFEWATWILFASSLVMLVLAMTLVLYHRFQILDAVFVVLDIMEIILTGGTSRTITWTSQRLAVMCVIFLHVLAGNAYTGLLLGFLTLPKHFEDLNTIRDAVAATDRLYASTNDIYFIHNKLQETSWELQKEIIYIYRADQRNNCVRDILHTGKAAMLVDEKLYDVISRYTRHSEESRIMLHKIKEPVRSPNFESYLVRRNHLIIHVLNNLVLRLYQAGLFHQWQSNHLYSLDVDGQRDTKIVGGDDGPEKLRLVQFSGPFLLWGGGLCLAGIAFLFEQFRGRAWIPTICRILAWIYRRIRSTYYNVCFFRKKPEYRASKALIWVGLNRIGNH